MRQTTSKVFMIRPKNFGSNPDTLESNSFQAAQGEESSEEIQAKALKEFDHFVEILQAAGVQVMVIEDSESPNKPDAIFPNNWISTHDDGSLITYPMYSEKRRSEKREDIIELLLTNFKIGQRYTFDHYEDDHQFLEGTGSMLLDRIHKVVYACLSPRTSVELLNKFAVLKGYEAIHFRAYADGTAIYHTNVLMALGEEFVVICMDAIPDEADRKKLLSSFKRTGKEVIDISIAQMNAYAGNMIQLYSRHGNHLIVMSKSAHQSLNKQQIESLSRHGMIISADLSTIEKYGGGSARCMIAENFLEYSNDSFG